MIYAKIDDQGNVLEFPYDFERTVEFMQTREVPADAVEVDVETNRPDVSWDEVYNYADTEVVDGAYIATFTTRDRYATAEDKLKGITTLKRVELAQNDRAFAARSKALREKYSDAEVASWDQQRTEAAAYIADDTSTTPLLSAIASGRGITALELAQKVIANASEYDAAFGSLLGKYQKNRELLNAIALDNDTTWDNANLLERF